jgi:hypothetical protein
MPALHEPGRTGQAHIQMFALDASAPVRWRLLSGINRELGRGVAGYDSLESCRLGIKHLQSVTSELEPAVQRHGSSTWVWMLSYEGEQVATSGHRYDRLIRCQQGLTHFIAQLAECEIGPVLMVTQARRWSAVSTRAVAEPRARP